MYSQNAFLLYNVNTFWAISHPPPPQGADVICEGPYVLMYYVCIKCVWLLIIHVEDS